MAWNPNSGAPMDYGTLMRMLALGQGGGQTAMPGPGSPLGPGAIGGFGSNPPHPVDSGAGDLPAWNANVPAPAPITAGIGDQIGSQAGSGWNEGNAMPSAAPLQMGAATTAMPTGASGGVAGMLQAMRGGFGGKPDFNPRLIGPRIPPGGFKGGGFSMPMGALMGRPMGLRS